jgi:hypothetical protein
MLAPIIPPPMTTASVVVVTFLHEHSDGIRTERPAQPGDPGKAFGKDPLTCPDEKAGDSETYPRYIGVTARAHQGHADLQHGVRSHVEKICRRI